MKTFQENVVAHIISKVVVVFQEQAGVFVVTLWLDVPSGTPRDPRRLGTLISDQFPPSDATPRTPRPRTNARISEVGHTVTMRFDGKHVQLTNFPGTANFAKPAYSCALRCFGSVASRASPRDVDDVWPSCKRMDARAAHEGEQDEHKSS